MGKIYCKFRKGKVCLRIVRNGNYESPELYQTDIKYDTISRYNTNKLITFVLLNRDQMNINYNLYLKPGYVFFKIHYLSKTIYLTFLCNNLFMQVIFYLKILNPCHLRWGIYVGYKQYFEFKSVVKI